MFGGIAFGQYALFVLAPVVPVTPVEITYATAGPPTDILYEAFASALQADSDEEM